jgi:hypothetical protein
MADVYSVSVAQVQGLDGNQVIFVPDGHVLVIRDIWAYWNSSSELFAKLHVSGDDDQTFFFALWTTIDADPLAFWQGRAVIQNHITLSTDNPVDVTVSGYSLSLP